MTDIETSSSDTVRIHAVEFFEKLKGVSEPKAAEQNTIAGGILVAVRHKKDGTDNWGWHFEKGEIRKSLSRGTDLAMFIEGQMAQKPFSDFIRTTPFLELMKLCVVSVLTILFAIAVIYIVIQEPDNKSLQVLTGLLGLTIGYFVGKTDTPKIGN